MGLEETVTTVLKLRVALPAIHLSLTHLGLQSRPIKSGGRQTVDLLQWCLLFIVPPPQPHYSGIVRVE